PAPWPARTGWRSTTGSSRSSSSWARPPSTPARALSGLGARHAAEKACSGGPTASACRCNCLKCFIAGRRKDRCAVYFSALLATAAQSGVEPELPAGVRALDGQGGAGRAVDALGGLGAAGRSQRRWAGRAGRSAGTAAGPQQRLDAGAAGIDPSFAAGDTAAGGPVRVGAQLVLQGAGGVLDRRQGRTGARGPGL